MLRFCADGNNPVEKKVEPNQNRPQLILNSVLQSFCLLFQCCTLPRPTEHRPPALFCSLRPQATAYTVPNPPPVRALCCLPFPLEHLSPLFWKQVLLVVLLEKPPHMLAPISRWSLLPRGLRSRGVCTIFVHKGPPKSVHRGSLWGPYK